MTRAGEKLYGEWQRATDSDRTALRSAWLWRRLAGVALLCVIGGSALFGFG